ncbi:unnamed protein product [Timema podura]|uniref:Uncharacterized protein n=1 Tax=Timema podura TaxID=61482 RepID=A0ABN7NVN2_TIMPD|nr:unnamed protein product [Timema podura]
MARTLLVNENYLEIVQRIGQIFGCTLLNEGRWLSSSSHSNQLLWLDWGAKKKKLMKKLKEKHTVHINEVNIPCEDKQVKHHWALQEVSEPRINTSQTSLGSAGGE